MSASPDPLQRDPERPVPASARLPWLDVLRGFALLGILLVNMEFFSRPLQAVALGPDPSLDGLDRWVALATQVLLQGKFYALFALLFGAGFALMLECGLATDGFLPRYLRRLAALAGFGLVHALWIWSGDILLAYAGFGLLLLGFACTPVGRLPLWAGLCFAAPLGLLALSTWGLALDPGGEAMRALEAERTTFIAELAQAETTLRGGTFAEVSAQRREDLRFMLGSLALFGSGILGYLLLGAWLLRSGRLLDPARHAGFFRACLRLGFGIGLPLCVTAALLLQGRDRMLPDAHLLLATTLETLGSLLLALGYLGAVLRLLARPAWAPRLALLAPAGRMALSNYLLQSLLWTFVFYGYGLGLYGQVPRWAMALLALGCFALQVMLSRFWLQRFAFGPTEWLWRALTYLRWPALRRG